MYRTIEAIYDNGKLIFPEQEMPEGRIKILITYDVREKEQEKQKEEYPAYKEGTYKNPDLLDELSKKLKGKMPDGVEFQNKLRKQWQDRMEQLEKINEISR